MFRTAHARTLAIGVAAMFVGLLVAPLVDAQVASAQEPPPVRIRGTIERVDGAQIQDGENKITVPANAPIVTYVPGDKSDIKAGAKVFIVAVKQAEWHAARPRLADRPRRRDAADVIGAGVTYAEGADATAINDLFRCGAAAKYRLDHLSSILSERWQSG